MPNANPPNPSLGSVTSDLLKLMVRLVTLLIEAVAWWLATQRKDKGP